MITAPNSNDVLRHYIDTLLLEVPSAEGEGNENLIDSTRPIYNAWNVKYGLDKAPNADAIWILLFKVADIPVAIPCAAIAEVVDVEHSCINLTESKEGIVVRHFSYHGQEVCALDTREIILPSGESAHRVKDDEEIVHILIIKGVSYGLLCGGVCESVDIHPQEVEWRSRRTTRPWLAGMVKGYNHALLDTQEIIHAGERLLKIAH